MANSNSIIQRLAAEFLEMPGHIARLEQDVDGIKQDMKEILNWIKQQGRSYSEKRRISSGESSCLMKSDKDAPIKSEFHFTTARQHYVNRRSSIERLSTGSRNIDDILCGGIETKAVTEFYGAPSSGKTQLCHTMCTILPQDKSKEGICGKSIYIDTEGTFRPERIESIAKARGFDFSLDNILLVEPVDSDQQERNSRQHRFFNSKYN